MSTEESPAVGWVRGLSQAARAFSEVRNVSNLTVRLVLSDGSSVLAHRVAAGPGPNLVTIDVYPDDPEDDMVEGLDDDGQGPVKRTPTAIMLDPRSVQRVELLVEPPGEQALGFAPPEDS